MNKNIIYPPEFIKKVKENNPLNTVLHKLLEEGNNFVICWLETYGEYMFDPDEIIKSFNEKKQDEIYIKAQWVKRNNELAKELNKFLEANEIII